MSKRVDRVAAWACLLRVHAALLPKLERELTRAGLPLTWYDVLLVLNAAPDRRLTMGELGARAVVSRERVSRVVQELERAGLVERSPNPDDKRSSYAQISSEGRHRLAAIAPVYLAEIQAHFTGHLSDREIVAVANALGKVLAAGERSRLGAG
jgi:DNA-binding MarR family transcriptional regulator